VNLNPPPQRALVALASLMLMAAGSSLSPAPVAAQTLPGPVVDAAWLSEQLGAPDLVVVRVGGGEDAFAQGHIPGARYVDLGAVTYSFGERDDPDQVRLDVPRELSEVRDALEALGISDGSRVVVTYDEARRVTTATRFLWTLEFMGMGGRSALLDGGTEAWRDAGGVMEDGPPDRPSVGRLTLGPQEDRRVDRRWVLENLDTPGVAVVDGRRPDAWSGERPEFPGRAGHIPGAGNLPIEELFGEDGRLRPREELQDLLARAGVDEGDTVVAYCHIGLRATAVILAARAAGYRAVLYDGSMNEWARDPELPLVREGGPGGGP
jgi:thiosulfate/3-mercaptopyruvate sulfurtransferase